jgi:hypothetical protein
VDWVVTCECGHAVRARDEDAVVEGVAAHLTDSHPDLVGVMSRADILRLAGRT